MSNIDISKLAPEVQAFIKSLQAKASAPKGKSSVFMQSAPYARRLVAQESIRVKRPELYAKLRLSIDAEALTNGIKEACESDKNLLSEMLLDLCSTVPEKFQDRVLEAQGKTSEVKPKASKK